MFNCEKSIEILDSQVLLILEQSEIDFIASINKYLDNLNDNNPTDKAIALECIDEELNLYEDQTFGFWTLNGYCVFTYNGVDLEEDDLPSAMVEYITFSEHLHDKYEYWITHLYSEEKLG